ncbi:MAG: FABP family protein [Acidimicrobiia bacterium]
MSADPPQLHESLIDLAFLLGTWSGPGHGEYPTIEPFDYLETVTFGHAGKPNFAYTQRTVDATSGLPLHAEAGYLRHPSPGVVELVIAQPSGIVEVQEGTFEIAAHGGRFELRSRAIASTTTAKQVTEVERSVLVDGDELFYTLRMAAVGQPLTHHLEATLRRE